MSDLKDLRSQLLSASKSDINVVAKAENLESGENFDWDKIFFEPQVNNTYTVKFLPNLISNVQIVHRQVYNNLPDPKRKGKTFNFTSPGNRNCPVLQLFFDLNDLKKQGDVIAEEKIKKYLGKKNQACSYVQILSSPKKEEIGQIKLMRYPSFSEKATIATLLDQKLNPSKEQLEAGFEKENVFDIFESSVLVITCKESVFEGQKMRDMSASTWGPKKRGAIAKVNDELREFKSTDLVDENITDEASPYFDALITELVNPDISIFTWFEYKDINDERNSDDAKKYLQETKDKLDEILPILRNSSLQEIASYGKADTTTNTDKADKAKDIMQESIPEELQGITGATNIPNTPASTGSDEVDALLAD
jgi:hypothetical protein